MFVLARTINGGTQLARCMAALLESAPRFGFLYQGLKQKVINALFRSFIVPCRHNLKAIQRGTFELKLESQGCAVFPNWQFPGSSPLDR